MTQQNEITLSGLLIRKGELIDALRLLEEIVSYQLARAEDGWQHDALLELYTLIWAAIHILRGAGEGYQ